MKRIPIATAAAVLALAPAAFAASGEAWYGSNRVVVPAPMEATRLYHEPAVVYEAPAVVYDAPTVVYDTARRPLLVERGYVVDPRATVIHSDGYAYRGDYLVRRDDRDLVDHLNPHTSGVLNRGLFPRKGPSDFGS